MESDKRSNGKSDVFYDAEDNNKAKKLTSHKYETDKSNNQNNSCKKTVPSLIKHELLENSGERGFQKAKLSSQGTGMEPTANSINFVVQSKCSNAVSSNSPKMGSRRIFTPQFKLQVLESYRNDNDCKGNQRATARKYNIHRRQIQKWLQCESNLRSSVANINQNNVKHQFHNINHQQQLPQHSTLTSSIVVPTTNNVYLRHHTHHHSQVSLELQGVVPNLSQHVGSCSAAAAAASTQTVNISAVVAAAAAAAGSGGETFSIGNKSSKNQINSTSSPVRPTAIGGTACKNLPSTILHPHHHHHHYPLSSYTHTPASVSVSMPIISQQFHHHHNHYQYHNIPTHIHSTLTQSQQNTSTYLPSVCLPVSTSLNTTTINSHSFEKFFNKAIESGEYNFHNEKLHELNKSSVADLLYRNDETYGQTECNTLPYTNFTPFAGNVTVPMDLSVNSRRICKENFTLKLNETPNCQDESQPKSSHVESVVSLAIRKRKVVSPICKGAESPEKLFKTTEGNGTTETSDNENFDKNKLKNNDSQIEEEVDVENEDKLPPIKPIKLFKPYLLDEKDEYNKDSNNDCNASVNDLSKIATDEATILKSSAMSASSADFESAHESNRLINFQSHMCNKYAFPSSSPSFQDTNNEIISIRPASSTYTLSPTSFRCPKGSPVSGYESSSSTCSESNESFVSADAGTYTFQINMQSICKDNIVAENRQVQKWLDHDTITSHTPAAKSSILYMLA